MILETRKDAKLLAGMANSEIQIVRTPNTLYALCGSCGDAPYFSPVQRKLKSLLSRYSLDRVLGNNVPLRAPSFDSNGLEFQVDLNVAQPQGWFQVHGNGKLIGLFG